MASSSPKTQNYVNEGTKLRHLRTKSWNKIVAELSINDRWLEIAARVRNPDNNDLFLLTSSQINILKNVKNCAPAQEFLVHWSTSGIQQPTVGDLIRLLIDSDLYRAADILSCELLQNTASDHFGSVNGTLAFNENDNIPLNNSCSNKSNAEEVSSPKDAPHKVLDATIEQNLNGLQKYEYERLADMTKRFLNYPIHQGGCKIGEGAFGVVYMAYSHGIRLAVKRLKEAVDNQFLNELEILSEYKHENLLPLLGYSNDGPHCCLVYLYMTNGSLQERLACLGNSKPISWSTRISIAYGTAKGIFHLHSFKSEPRIHRDIKSANILLDEKFVPKLGDFGLTRIGKNSTTTTSICFTSNVYGTAVYMPHEAFNGEVTVKLDSFSYGVVLLELLTGLPPYDTKREETDLTSFINENYGNPEDIVKVLDKNAGEWDQNVAISLYEISKGCSESRRKSRSSIEEVLPKLQQLAEQTN